MTDKATHTPLPWMLATNDPTLIVTEALDADGNCAVVADVLTAIGPATLANFSDAAFIVHAVNSHHDLIEALRAAKTFIERIEQTPANVWHVATDDPEATCSEAYQAVCDALTKEAGHG